MPGSIFLDTNILVCAIEADGPDAARSAGALALCHREGVVLSVQVLGEFYRTVTSARRAVPLRHVEATAWVQLWKRLDVRPITVPQVDLALEMTGKFRLSYFDALILASARFAGCEVVFSEDMQSGRDYGGVRVENPFLPGASRA